MPSVSLTSDTGSSATDGITSNGSVTVGGLESGATWQYSTDGSSWIDGSGSSFATGDDGDKTVHVRQTDVAGNTSSAITLSFTVDATAPEGVALFLDTNSGNTSDSITNDGTINVDYIEDGATWQYSTDGSTWSDGSGSSFQLTGDGAKSVQVRQTDVAGNTNSSGSLNFTLDTEAASALTLSLTSDTGSNASDHLTNSGSVTVSGIESGASWQYNLDGSTWTDGSGSSFSTTGNGAKSVQVRQTDAAGNTGSSSSLSFTVDATAPEGLGRSLATNSGNGSDSITNNGTVNIAYLESGATWQYSTDGSTWTDGSGSSFTTSGDGDKTVRVRQIDVAGNTSSTTSLSFTLDTSASVPSVSLTSDTGSSTTDGITSNGSVTVGGLESGATWQYSLNEGSTWNDGSGSSFATGDDGDKTVHVRQTDVAGNTSSAITLSFTVDATAPEGVALFLDTNSGNTSDSITNDGTINIDYLEDGAIWQYSTDGSTWTDGSGSSFQLTGDGSKSVQVRQSDAAGNINSSGSLNFTLDTEAPNTLTLSLTSDTGSSATDLLTNSGSVTVSGIESGASWQYNLDGSTWTDGSGSSFSTTGNGAKSVQVRQTDAAGNTGSSSSLSFTVDATAPEGLGRSLATNSGNGSDSITNNGTVNIAYLESGASWQYSTDGSTWTDGSGSSFTTSGDGAKTVRVRQIDVAGNTSSITSLSFTVDATAPDELDMSLATNSGSTSDLITNDGTVNIDSLEDGASWQYSTDGSTWSDGSGSSFVVTEEGEQTVLVRQTDVAGNTSSTASLSFTLDTTAPEGLGLALATNSGNGSDAITNDGTVNVDYIEDSAIWQYSTDGSTWTDGSGSSFTTTGDGSKTVRVRQIDVAGNTSSTTSLSFTLDATAPEGLNLVLSSNSGSTSDSITNNGTVNVGYIESGATWQYSTDGSTWTNGSGNNFTLSGDGDKTVRVRQTDTAGNTGSTTSLSFTLDTSAAAPSLALASDTGSSATDGITSNGSVTVSKLESGATWQYSLDGSTWSDGSGSSFATSGDGAQTVFVRQTDVASNTSSTTSLSFMVDTTTPDAVALALATNSGSTSDSITNDGTINISGLESAATWQYSLDGSTWTDGSGSAFDLTDDGAKSLQVRQIDVAGNTSSSASLSFTLDTMASAPTAALTSDTGSSASDNITKNGSVTVGGLESGATWQYSLNNGSSWTNGSGSTFTTSGDGTKNVLVRQTDVAGNTSSDGSLSFLLDTAFSSKKQSLSLASDTGTSSGDTITNVGTINLFSTPASGDTWQYSLDGSTWSDGSGNNFTVTGDGAKSVLVRVSDPAGNTATSFIKTFTLDTTAPAALTPSLTSDTGGSATDLITTDGNVTVSGLESGATWQYSLDSSTWTTGTGSSFATTGDGAKTVLVRQTDVAGNTGSSSSLSFTIDTTAPDVPSLALASNGGNPSDTLTNDGTVNVTNLEGGASWQYSTDGSTWNSGSGSSFAATGDGAKTVLVRQIDAAGNMGSSTSLSFTLDATAPEGMGLALATNSGNGTDTITNEGTVNVDYLEDGAIWQYSTDGSTWTDGSGSTFTLTGDGDKAVRVRQIDTAGNHSSTTSLSFTLDTNATTPAPILTSDNGTSATDLLTNNGSVTVNGLESGATWQYSLDSSTWNNGSGNSFTVTGDDGSKTVLVRQTDVASNTSSVASLSFTLDATAPEGLNASIATNSGNATDSISNDGTINVTGFEDDLPWQYSVDAGSTWTDGSGSSFDITGDGSKAVRVRQTDAAGNHSSGGSLSFTLDTSAVTPSLSLASDTGSNSSDGMTSNGTVNVGGLESGAVWEYNTGGSDWTTGIGSSFTVTGGGEKAVSVRQTDAAGNASSTSTTLNFTMILANLSVSALNGSNGFRLDGSVAFDQSGGKVSSAGDVNGDGFDDMLVAASGFDANSLTGSGAAYVVFGKSTGFDATMNLSTLDGSNGFRLNGAAVNAATGMAVQGAGDVNGDGYADVIIGASGITDAFTSVGATYVVFGKSAGFSATLDLSTLNSSNGFKMVGATTNAQTGFAVGAAGDINGDGYHDVVVGGPGSNASGSGAGISYVVFGQSSSFSSSISLSGLDGNTGFTLTAGTTGERLGYMVGSAGDLNGDGYDDLLVGAPRSDLNATDSGLGYVVFGKSSGFDASLSMSSLNGTNGFRLAGHPIHGKVAMSGGNAGDVNGDGYNDLILGAYGTNTSTGATYVIFGKSSGFSSTVNLSGLDGNTGFRLNGVASSDRSGSAVSGAGDLNGDGYADLLIGAPAADLNSIDGTGAAYVVYGKSSFSSSINLSSLDGDIGYRLDGVGATHYVGMSVSSAGDINGDGLDDLMTGTSTAAPNGISSGSTYVVYGSKNNNVATNGADSLSDAGAVAVFHAGAGDDTITVSSLGFQHVDGGNGTDTLALNGSNLTLNLATVRGKLDNIEVIDLTGSGNNSVTLTAVDVRSLSDTTNTLRVNGNSGDSTLLIGAWNTDNNVSGGYKTYSLGAATVQVSENVSAAISNVTAPSATLASDTGSSASDSYTNNGNVNVSGLASGATWEYSLNGGSSWSSGSGSSFLTSGNGEKNVLVRQTDTNSITSANGSLSFTLDTSVQMPDPALGNGAADTTYDGVVVVFDIEDSATWQYSLNGGSNWTAGSGSEFTVSSIGAHTVHVRQTDLAGNTSGTNSMTFTRLSTPTQLSSLNGSNGFRMDGPNSDDLLGLSVSTAGDINGDGYDDLIIGARGTDYGNVEDSGVSYVVFGKQSGFDATLSLSSLNGENGFLLHGNSTFLYTGWSVSNAGDVDGDGKGDLIVGVPHYSDGESGGAAFVFKGRNGSFESTYHVAGDDTVPLIDTVASDDRTGKAVSSAGDINGDGYDDLLIGSPGFDGSGLFDNGAVFVLFGSSNLNTSITLQDLDGTNGFRLQGLEDGDELGFSVSDAGDVNGDGYDDLIVGTPAADVNSYSDNGAAYVLFGHSGGFSSTINVSALDGSNGFRMQLSSDNTNIGRSVSSAGDINGDGIDDLIIGARGPDSSDQEDRGVSYIVFGMTSGFDSTLALDSLSGTAGFRIEGAAGGGDRWGSSVSGAGDVNGDGYDDLLIGAYKANLDYVVSGNAYVLFGKSSGFNATESITDLLTQPDALFSVGGVPSNGGEAHVGISVSTAGDVNGDGFADILIGADQTSTGSAFVVFGSDISLLAGLMGSAENDTLESNSGADVIYTGAGDDTLRIHNFSIQRIDGGSGTDTLLLVQDGTYDLADVRGRVRGIEVIDMTAEGSSTLTLTLQDVLSLSDTSNRLRVDAGQNDTVQFTGGWVNTGTDGDHVIMTLGGATLLLPTFMFS
ncbi:MAG: Ig-like domain-containing protein [Pseudomonadota bacterium]